MSAERVLDLGTGNGRLVAMLKRRRPGLVAVAVDFSPTMLDLAAARFAGDPTVTVVAHDTYGNVSDLSAEVHATPVESSDFYDHYRDSGGSSLGGGGCSTGATSAWVAGIVLAISLALRRRRKARTGAALGAVLALLGAQAKADELATK